MAQSPSMGASALAASDLIIDIRPFFICRYRGTSAQLLAEGLLPDGFKWPERTGRVCFEDARFSYWVERARPPGTKGPMSTWTNGDYWVLDVSCKGYRADFATLQIREKLNEVAELQKRGTPEWNQSWDKAYTARKDSKYMQFRAQLIGDMALRKRGRKPSTTPQQGVQA